jgi:hypothetical protein
MDLVALEEIRRLKYRYLRSVDQKRWDDLESTLTPDAVADYGTPAEGRPEPLVGRATIMKFLRDGLSDPGVVTFHSAGQPEIDIDGDTATGIWAFEDTVIYTEQRLVVKGAAYYEDRYVRTTEAGWRISHVGYVRTYEMVLSLDDLPSLRLTT